jgi:2-keto-4-pentenoate hydratase/2-oxohepta-3-ene-1,7-dioic acid hydratase in catechol pathway
MKLVTFTTQSETASTQPLTPNSPVAAATLSLGIPTPGVLLGNDEIADLSSLGYPTVLSIIEAGPSALKEIQSKLAKVPHLPLSTVTLLAPIPRPPRIFAIGLNYQKHAAESNMQVQKVPTVFMKLSSTVIGPDTPIILPKLSTQPDYEAEFAAVIGKPGYQIPAASAMDYVFGYTIVNDVTARDLQHSHKQWFKGKSLDGSCPLGPVIVTSDEIPDPSRLRLTTTVNGERRQDASLSQMIFGVAEIIAHLSKGMTLEPGDVIATGTPSGVGYARKPPGLLEVGDEVAVAIDGIGELRNRIG